MCHRKGHLDSFDQIRQMMADQKFYEAQVLIEHQFQLNPKSRESYLRLYFDVLEAQGKVMSDQLKLELAESESEQEQHEFVLSLLKSIQSKKLSLRILKLKIKAAEDKGQMDQLYQQLSEYLVAQYENQRPYVEASIEETIHQYFKTDFNLKLKLLALKLLVHDLESSEKMVKDLITSSVEKSSLRGLSQKLEAIGNVLKATGEKGVLEIYQSLCFIHINGISEKADYKRLVEMVIYFEDYNFQVLLLDLLLKLGLEEEAISYTDTLRLNPGYDFVYLDKYYPHLKKYFVELKAPKQNLSEEIPAPDLELTEKNPTSVMSSTSILEHEDQESRFFHLLKYQDYTADQLCDLAVSFLQSELPRVALKASEMAVSLADNETSLLKGSYLKFTCLMELKDYRAALDTCLEALTHARTQDDVLSFLYGEAEVYIRLNEIKNAKKVLKRVLSIDDKYRLAKERLEKL